MKRPLSLFLTLALTLALAACGPSTGQTVSNPTPDGDGSVSTPPEASSRLETSTPAENPETPDEDGGKILIAYFSATNNTKGSGQILLVTGGRGWFQEWGRLAQALHAGDVVNIPAGVKHWHEATKDSWFVHLAVEVPGEDSSSEWLEPVADVEYDRLDQT